VTRLLDAGTAKLAHRVSDDRQKDGRPCAASSP
jgi:hypothetical protein